LYDRAELVGATSTDLVQFTAPRVAVGYAGDTTGARTESGAALYFVGGTEASPGFYRSSVGPAGAGGEPESVQLPGTSLLPYWPQAAGLHDGRVLLAFVESQERAFLAVSSDGILFEQRSTPVPSGARRGILSHVGETRGGSWVFSHQLADSSWLFTSFVHL